MKIEKISDALLNGKKKIGVWGIGYIGLTNVIHFAESGVKSVCFDINKKVVEDYLSGKEEALNFLLGQVMKKTKGKANPKEIREMMLRLIKDNN